MKTKIFFNDDKKIYYLWLLLNDMDLEKTEYKEKKIIDVLAYDAIWKIIIKVAIIQGILLSDMNCSFACNVSGHVRNIIEHGVLNWTN